MRELGAGVFAGRVSCFTGPGRASGKTCLLLAALGLLRAAGEGAGVLGIGFEGEAKGLATSGRPATRLRLEAGELFASSASWLGGTGTEPEILGLLSGSGAFGRLALARARRRGEVVLVGPESNEATAEAVALMREAGAGSVLVDGAFGRLTQVAAIADSRFFASLILDRGNLVPSLSWMRRLALLLDLPLAEGEAEAGGESPGEAGIDIEGPLTAGLAATLPERPSRVVVEDFTKVFLEEAGLRSLLRRHGLFVRRRPGFGGFVLARRGLSPSELEAALGDSIPGELLFASPYEGGRHERVA